MAQDKKAEITVTVGNKVIKLGTLGNPGERESSSGKTWILHQGQIDLGEGIKGSLLLYMKK